MHMNRKQRRAAAKAVPGYLRGKTVEDRKRQLYRNGITDKDLQRSAQTGYNKGASAAAEYTMHVCYAAAVRAYGQVTNNDPDANTAFLRLMDDMVVNAIDSDEAIQAAFDEAGVSINFREGLPEERVQEIPAKPHDPKPGEWTRCVKQLPKKPGKYLAHSQTGAVYTSMFDPDVHRKWPHFGKVGVDAWAVLPEWKEENGWN